MPDNAALRASLNALDPATLHSLDNLTKEDATLLLRVFAGAKVLEKASPDRLMRARLLTEGGGDLILAAETHGDDVANAAYRLLAAQDVGQLPVGSVQRFAEHTAKRGEGFLRAWKTWVEPNWKELASAGLLLAILASPDSFIDAAGKLTAYATDIFTRLGIRIATEVITAVPKTVTVVTATVTEVVKRVARYWGSRFQEPQRRVNQPICSYSALLRVRFWLY